MSDNGGPRAPFECVCGFTAGTSFAWEKHLALRNTPYSSVKHCRVTKNLDSSLLATPHDSGNSSQYSYESSERDVGNGTRPSPSFPTPKALFRDRSSLGSDTSSSPYRSQLGGNQVALQGLKLEEAAKKGDMDRVARLAVEILRLAQDGDAEGVLDVIGRRGKEGSGASGLDRREAERRAEKREVQFASHITALHRTAQGVSIEQVPTGLKNALSAEAVGRKDALRLLAMTEPLLDSASPATQHTPAQFGVDIHVLKRTIIAVAQHATRITSKENRVLEVASPVYVLGDIHGNLVDLQFFRKTLWAAGPEVTAGDFLFLGDFVDRGRDSIPVIAYIMSMKILNPSKWWLIRGNHETREVNGNIEHYQEGSFLHQCLLIFGESDGYAVWEAINNFFDTLPLAASIDDSIFCVHGGIPRELCRPGSSLDIVRQIECPLRSVQADELVYDMLWSDPSSPEQEHGGDLDATGFGLSARGCTCFGERSIELFLDIHKFQHVFRGHEAQQSGVGVSKGARLTTIFSTSKDHFSGEVASTCGCVLVDHDVIYPVVRALASTRVGLKPTYAGQSVEALEVHVTDGRRPSLTAPDGASLVYTRDHSYGSVQTRQAHDRAWASYWLDSAHGHRGHRDLPRAWEEVDPGLQPGSARLAGR